MYAISIFFNPSIPYLNFYSRIVGRPPAATVGKEQEMNRIKPGKVSSRAALFERSSIGAAPLMFGDKSSTGAASVRGSTGDVSMRSSTLGAAYRSRSSTRGSYGDVSLRSSTGDVSMKSSTKGAPLGSSTRGVSTQRVGDRSSVGAARLNNRGTVGSRGVAGTRAGEEERSRGGAGRGEVEKIKVPVKINSHGFGCFLLDNSVINIAQQN